MWAFHAHFTFARVSQSFGNSCIATQHESLHHLNVLVAAAVFDLTF